MLGWFAFFSSFTISALTIRLASPFAEKFGLIDIPGGHKQHPEPVPLVGGISVYVSILLAWLLMAVLGLADINSVLMLGSGILFAVGIFDDRFKLSVTLRLIMQTVAVLLMISGNVILHDLGAIVAENTLELGVIAIPMTIFATIGVINAMNMMDGIDGLAGMLSLATLAPLLGVIVLVSGYQSQLILIACLMGAIGGFLLFNLRWHGVDKAQVYLGDAGSTVLGFLLAWLFISMSQGEVRAMTPVTALWIFAIPLIDTVGVMLRRIKENNSPFTADRYHIHHLLVDAGFKVSHTVNIIASAQLILGFIGLIGLYLRVPEMLMFVVFLGLAAAYVYKISTPKHSIPMFREIHGKAGLVRDNVRMVYVGDLKVDSAKDEIEKLLGEKVHEHYFEIYHGVRNNRGETFAYAIIDANHSKNVKKLISQLYRSQGLKDNKNIHQFVIRNSANDERFVDLHPDLDIRKRNRRSSKVKRVYCSQKKDQQLTAMQSQVIDYSAEVNE